MKRAGIGKTIDVQIAFLGGKREAIRTNVDMRQFDAVVRRCLIGPIAHAWQVVNRTAGKADREGLTGLEGLDPDHFPAAEDGVLHAAAGHPVTALAEG